MSSDSCARQSPARERPVGQCRSPAAGTRWAASSSGRPIVLVDTRDMNGVLDVRRPGRALSPSKAESSGRSCVEHLQRAQAARTSRSGGFIRSRQAPTVSASAARLSCNAHGRGLDAEADRPAGGALRPAGCPTARLRRCSREQNAELFRLAIGGYGLFGIITRVQLKLRPRVKVRRVVELGRDRLAS